MFTGPQGNGQAESATTGSLGGLAAVAVCPTYSTAKNVKAFWDQAGIAQLQPARFQAKGKLAIACMVASVFQQIADDDGRQFWLADSHGLLADPGLEQRRARGLTCEAFPLT